MGLVIVVTALGGLAIGLGYGVAEVALELRERRRRRAEALLVDRLRSGSAS